MIFTPTKLKSRTYDVLVIEDNLKMRKLLDQCLSLKSIRCELADCVDSAIRVLETTASIPKVVVAGLMREEDCMKIRNVMRARFPSVPVILLTDTPDSLTPEEKDRFNCVIKKPQNKKDLILISTIQKLL